MATYESRSLGAPASAARWPARVQALPVQTVVYWILRIAVACEFIGHGAAGITGNPAWLPYFAVVGIGHDTAYRLMPLIGTLDIALGVLTLFRPLRAVLLYYTIWGCWTALLRPLAGEGIWELVERAYNYGVPLALLVLVGPGTSMRTWCVEKALPRWDARTAQVLTLILRWVTGLMLIGHGGIGALLHKTGWTAHFGVLGIGAEMVRSLSLIAAVGWCEIALGLAVLIKPMRGLLLFVIVWKVGTELLRPLAGEPIWQFIERAGAYAAPLALLVLLSWQGRTSQRVRTGDHDGAADVPDPGLLLRSCGRIGGPTPVLAYLFPREANFLLSRPAENAASRLWAGIRFRNACDEGIRLGEKVANTVIDWTRGDGS